MSARAKQGLVLGVDLGTSATKVVAATREGVVLHETERTNHLRTEEPGEAVQDAEVVRDAAVDAVAECAGWAQDNGHTVEAVSFSSAMHTLLGVDAAGKPVTPALTWADTRCSEVADSLRADGGAVPELHAATGTPVHTQSVMVKLAWLGRSRTDLARGVAQWCALKDFVVAGFIDELVTEHSMASGTGLQGMHSLDWHEPALEVAGIVRDQLPKLESPTETRKLTSSAAKATGLPNGLPVVLGGGDGPLGNLGVGAVNPGVAGLSLGTSGALRAVLDRPGIDEAGRTFCYALADGLWVIGGAVSNGGGVAQWAAETFDAKLPDLMEEALAVPPGAHGLIALPYLLGERAPWWEPGLTGSLIGMRRMHGRAEITRALVEGVAQQLALVRDSVTDAGVDVRAVRATGGSFRSRVWAEVVAAALEVELELAHPSSGSGLGAVLLGWRALGALDSIEEAASLIRPSRTVPADPNTAKLMRDNRTRLDELHRVLQDYQGAVQP